MFFLWCAVRLLALWGLVLTVATGQSLSADGTSPSIPVSAKAVAARSLSTVTVYVTEYSYTGTPVPVPETFVHATSYITITVATTRTSTVTTWVTVTVLDGVPQPVGPRAPVFVEDRDNQPGPSVTTEFQTVTFTDRAMVTITGSTRTNYDYDATTIGPVTVVTVMSTTSIYLDNGVATTVTSGSSSSLISSTPDASTSTSTSVSISISTVTTSFFDSPGTNTFKGTMMTMRTTSSTSETSTGTAAPFPPDGDDENNDGGRRTRTAGIIIGAILACLLFCGLICWFFRRMKRKRSEKKVLKELVLPRTPGTRRERRVLRELASPRTGGAAGVAGAIRTDANSRRQNLGLGPRLARKPSTRVPQSPSEVSPYSTESGSHSGLTGEGEVRIVIRPAPSRRRTASSELIWPIPPGHRGPDINLYMERSTTTTPENPDDWSIVSDQGSRNSPFRSAGPSQSSSSGRQESYPMVTILSPTPANHRDRLRVAPWEAAPMTQPQRSATEPASQGSPASERTTRTGRSSHRPLLGGSSRFTDIV